MTPPRLFKGGRRGGGGRGVIPHLKYYVLKITIFMGIDSHAIGMSFSFIVMT